MKHRFKSQLILVAAVAFAATALLWNQSKVGGAPPQKVPVVFAASSLRDVMSDVAKSFEQKYSLRRPIEFNFAGSNILAQQLAAAPKADLFISANEEWVDHVEKAGRSVAGSRKAILSNRIVVVSNVSSEWKIKTPQDLGALPFKHLSLANPDAVPAGKYARAYLQGIPYKGKTLWEAVASRVAPAMNVRAALAMVESDPTVLGIVYRTDASLSSKARVLFEIPEKDVPPVHYVVTRISTSSPSEFGEKFFEYLTAPEAQKIFAKYGFIPLGTAEESTKR